MRNLTETAIRDAFVNCSKGEAKRLNLPRDIAETPWDDLDFLGWIDPGAPERAYVVTEAEDGRVVGIALRHAAKQRGFLHRSMCSLCLTTHPGNGVSLMAARRPGAAGRDGNTVGLYVCTDLACSLYVRGVKRPAPGGRMEESLSVDEQIARTRARLSDFVDRLTNSGS